MRAVGQPVSAWFLALVFSDIGVPPGLDSSEEIANQGHVSNILDVSRNAGVRLCYRSLSGLNTVNF